MGETTSSSKATAAPKRSGMVKRSNSHISLGSLETGSFLVDVVPRDVTVLFRNWRAIVDLYTATP